MTLKTHGCSRSELHWGLQKDAKNKYLRYKPFSVTVQNTYIRSYKHIYKFMRAMYGITYHATISYIMFILSVGWIYTIIL